MHYLGDCEVLLPKALDLSVGSLFGLSLIFLRYNKLNGCCENVLQQRYCLKGFPREEAFIKL